MYGPAVNAVSLDAISIAWYASAPAYIAPSAYGAPEPAAYTPSADLLIDNYWSTSKSSPPTAIIN